MVWLLISQALESPWRLISENIWETFLIRLIKVWNIVYSISWTGISNCINWRKLAELKHTGFVTKARMCPAWLLLLDCASLPPTTSFSSWWNDLLEMQAGVNTGSLELFFVMYLVKVIRKGVNTVPNRVLKTPLLNIAALGNKPSASKTLWTVPYPYHSDRKANKGLICEYISIDNWESVSLEAFWEFIWSGKPLGYLWLKQTIFWVKKQL